MFCDGEYENAEAEGLEIHFVELPRCRHNKAQAKQRLERWLMYLSSKTTPEESRQLAMEDADIRMAMEAEKEFVKDHRNRGLSQ